MATRPTRPLGKNTVTVIRAPLVTDPRDNTLYFDWSNTTTHDITNCMVEPYPLAEKLNVEDNRDRSFVRTALRVYAPKGSDVEYTDRFLYRGVLFDSFGDSNDWNHFDGSVNHVTFIMRRRSG